MLTNMKIFLVSLCLTYTSLAFCDLTKGSGKEVTIHQYAERINEELKQLNKAPVEKYLESIDNIRLKLGKYLTHKKRKCQGEFSILILLGKENIKAQRPRRRRKVRLSKNEKTICYLEMKNMQINYIKSSHEARKRFLIKTHETQIKELENQKVKALSNLQKAFN